MVETFLAGESFGSAPPVGAADPRLVSRLSIYVMEGGVVRVWDRLLSTGRLGCLLPCCVYRKIPSEGHVRFECRVSEGEAVETFAIEGENDGIVGTLGAENEYSLLLTKRVRVGT